MVKREIIMMMAILLALACAQVRIPTNLPNGLPTPPEETGETSLSSIYVFDFSRFSHPEEIGVDFIAWSPDDKEIFVAHWRDRSNYLYNFRTNAWVAMLSEEPFWLSQERERVKMTKKGYSLSPDSLYGVRLRDPDKELLIYRTDNPSEFIIPTNPSGYSFRSWFRGSPLYPAWSHNGRYIALVEGTFLPTVIYIVTLGGYQPQIYPKIIFDYEFSDGDGDKVLEGGEAISLKVRVKNEGKGMAKGVKVSLSGESKVIRYLNNEKEIGDIPAGKEKEALFGAILPDEIPSDHSPLIIKVTGEKVGDVQEAEFLVLMQATKVKGETPLVKICPRCKRKYPETYFRCPNCGERLILRE